MQASNDNLHEILLSSTEAARAEVFAAYSKLFFHLLDPENVSQDDIFEAMDLVSNRVQRKPKIIKGLLQQPDLPFLVFLVCAN